MKKHLILLMTMMLGITGCGNSDQLKAENESLTAQVENLTAELESVSTENDKNSKELSSIKESLEAAAKEVELQAEDVTVTVIDKGQLPKDTDQWRFSNYCTMVFQITNNTNKDIQGVEGNLAVKDLFNKEIGTMGCDFTGQVIPSGQTVTEDKMTYEVNEFNDNDTKFYLTDFKDLKFEYTVTQIVFTDGTVKE